MENAASGGAGHAATAIAVKVTFPISKKGPYSADVSPDTTIGSVREAAMDYFGVKNDAQFSYVLTHAGKDEPDEAKLGDIADHAHAVEFRLVKKITQG